MNKKETTKHYSLIKEYPGIPPDWNPGMLIEKSKFGYYPVDIKYRKKIVYFYEVEQYPEFWEEEKVLGYKILSYYKLDSIYSVERLSDNEIFSINDETIAGNIISFKIAGNIIIPLLGEKRRLEADLEALKKLIPVVFVSYDKKEIQKGSEYFWCYEGLFNKNKSVAESIEKVPRKSLTFSTEDAIDEYILLNKKLFSIEDIAKIYMTAKEGYNKPNLSYGKQSQELRNMAKSFINEK